VDIATLPKLVQFSDYAAGHLWQWEIVQLGEFVAWKETHSK